MLSPLQMFSKSSSTSSSSSPSSALSSTNKLKNLIQTLVLSHMCRLIRSLSKFKAIILNIINNNYDSTIDFPHHHYSRKTNRIILGSFRLHYNWCSSKSSTATHHVLPVLPTNKWNTVLPSEKQQQQEVVGENFHDLDLAGYLQWLEEKPHHGGEEDQSSKEINEIDLMAEMFIANCHEKFRLEKQESDRRFQEMLARGL
ncbi:hypothetical protein HN51_054203 [Arachis hypogaea]|uniref:Uncharacterized protein n=1 Tax=Arachis hypogaea TaxID=3818 RepID=A0A444XH12_ARAHY|nr:uncharacterized protein LOC107619544 [Arachis ipaensis]XP_025679678.1 uncharacterized protein LOC112779575 [Arachis hypogaea]QHN76714.1 uncharacterized protein DS421_19g646340 [Arachis hypogaea]RYQ88653.1 hypothetical protein Ahy_B09g095722 [Arachis hypogaea]